MCQRFKQKVFDSNTVDLKDLMSNNYFINGLSASTSKNSYAQSFAEYGQISYLQLRSMEEAYATYNYLDEKKNLLYQ